MPKTTICQPWDDRALATRLHGLVMSLPRERLDLVAPPAEPGTYLQFLATPRVESVLGRLNSTGQYCSYVGVASRSLRERIGRYRQTIADIPQIREQDLYLAILPCDSTAAARYCEAELIDWLNPVLNGLGWGSKVPGRTRRGRCSASDALLPGRPWAPAPSLVDQAKARMQVLEHLAALEPGGPRWPALTPTLRAAG